MTTLTGIRDVHYLASFLGKKVAIKASEGVYEIYPCLTEIHYNYFVIVEDSKRKRFRFPWSKVESPHVILSEDVKVEMK